ncbi:hypothetical protein LCGC14_3076960 [marine sediment metagenome]|uniref:Uncharacterized protein n=1 Tax=marine sediment metagenome TaxID=412755 RepID=A0A0F8Z530_9ZZZZ
MNMVAISWLLIIGGVILLVDAWTSLQFVRDKRWFCQAVRLERLMFALILIIVGVFL